MGYAHFLETKKCLPAENSVDRHFHLFSKGRNNRMVDMGMDMDMDTVGMDKMGIRRHIRIRILGTMHCLINYR